MVLPDTFQRGQDNLDEMEVFQHVPVQKKIQSRHDRHKT